MLCHASMLHAFRLLPCSIRNSSSVSSLLSKSGVIVCVVVSVYTRSVASVHRGVVPAATSAWSLQVGSFTPQLLQLALLGSVGAAMRLYCQYFVIPTAQLACLSAFKQFTVFVPRICVSTVVQVTICQCCLVLWWPNQAGRLRIKQQTSSVRYGTAL